MSIRKREPSPEAHASSGQRRQLRRLVRELCESIDAQALEDLQWLVQEHGLLEPAPKPYTRAQLCDRLYAALDMGQLAPEAATYYYGNINALLQQAHREMLERRRPGGQ